MHDASSKPEAFDINVHDSPPQKSSFDDGRSHFIAKQRPDDQNISLQSADTELSHEANFCPKSVTEQHSNVDDQCSQMLLSVEAKSVTADFQDTAVCESGDYVQLSLRPETAHSSQEIKLSVSEHFTEEHPASCTLAFAEDQRIDTVDTMKQMPETRRLVVDDESKAEQSVSEKHIVPYQEDQVREEHQEYQEEQQTIHQEIEEQPVELAFTKNIDTAEVRDESLQTAVCVDDFTSDDKPSAVSFAVCAEEPSIQDLERQPVALPTLLDLAVVDAVVDGVSQQPLARADITGAVCCVEPSIHELPVEELAAYDLGVPTIDKVDVEISQCEHFAEATTSLSENECGVQQLTIPDLFGDCVHHSHLPETMTCYEVEVHGDPLLAVEADEREATIGTYTPEAMSVVEDNLSLMANMPVLQTQREETIMKPDTAVQYEAAYLPEKSETVRQSTAETFVESEELLGAQSLPQYEADFPMIWKYNTDESRTDSRDPDVEMAGLETKYHHGYGEQYIMRHLVEEDFTVRSPFDFSEVEVEYGYRRCDDDDEEDTDSVTSEEWCVMEKERDVGLHMTLMEGITTHSHEQVLVGVGDFAILAEKPVDDTSTHETSSEYHINTASCTSKVLYIVIDFHYLNLLLQSFFFCFDFPTFLVSHFC